SSTAAATPPPPAAPEGTSAWSRYGQLPENPLRGALRSGPLPSPERTFPGLRRSSAEGARELPARAESRGHRAPRRAAHPAPLPCAGGGGLRRFRPPASPEEPAPRSAADFGDRRGDDLVHPPPPHEHAGPRGERSSGRRRPEPARRRGITERPRPRLGAASEGAGPRGAGRSGLRRSRRRALGDGRVL